MQRPQIEAWVHRVLDDLLSGRPVEDSLVELKADWPDDFKKAARRVAGHANSAAQQPILWLIGADEQGRRIPGASPVDTARWYSQLQSEFADGWAPPVQIFNVPRGEAVVVAAVFDTEGTPFVVNGPQGRSEIPWRNGTAVRSATRSELFGLLAEPTELPDFQVLRAQVTCREPFRGPWPWEATLDVYVAPKNARRITFPIHDMRAWIEGPMLSDRVEVETIRFRQSALHRNDSGDLVPAHDLNVDSIQVTVGGPGLLEISACGGGSGLIETAAEAACRVHFILRCVGKLAPVRLAVTLKSTSRGLEGAYRWRFLRDKGQTG